ncbi:unnamed protein product [Ectocarpus sp. 6 AP-2014]
MYASTEHMLFVGLDIGGTNLKAGVIDGTTGGQLLGRAQERLPEDRSPEAVVDRLVALCRGLLDEHGITWDDILYTGVGCPGQIDREAGVVIGASTFPAWHNVPLANLVQDRTGRPVTVLNDASAAASAEFASRGSQETIAVLTLGTGIGLGVVCAGRVVTGCRGLVEGGHMIVEPGPNGRLCACGQRGCLEMYASASAVAAIASERLGSGGGDLFPAPSDTPYCNGETGEEPDAVAPTTPTHGSPGISRRRGSINRSDSAVSLRIMELERRTSAEQRASAPASPSTPASAAGRRGSRLSGGGSKITAADVFSMAKKGDEVAVRVVEETCDYLGLACVNICRVLDPDAILLAGGMSKAEGLLEKVRKSFSSRGWKVLPHECEIDLAKTCVDAGVIGAAGAACCEYALSVRRPRRRPSSDCGSITEPSNGGLQGGKPGARSAWRSFLVGVGIGIGVGAAAVAVMAGRGGRSGFM